MKLVASARGEPTLFDLTVDPTEDNDLSRQATEETARLLELLDRWIKETPTSDGERSQISPEALERLRSLGYVQ